mgnify:CR=1 FL=1
MMAFLQGLLASVIRPIIQEELKELKEFAQEQHQQLESYKRHDLEAEQLIKAAETATTTEEVKAHLRRLRDSRAKLPG